MFSKPNYIEKFGDYYLLWFKNTNTYSCVDGIFYDFLELFYSSKSRNKFLSETSIKFHIDHSIAEDQYQRIKSYLNSCNTKTSSYYREPIDKPISSNFTYRKSYLLNNKYVKISTDRKKYLDVLHPIIAHLEVESSPNDHSQLMVTTYKDHIILEINNEDLRIFQSNELHKLQGKVLMHLINILHRKTENDWMGLLHASAVSIHDKGIIFFGQSGSGKSTLVSLLSSRGYNIIADDLVPVLTTDLQIYQNPSAVSIKHPSMALIKKFWPDERTYTRAIYSKGKGHTTFIPMQSQNTIEGVKCNHIIKVEYKHDGVTSLKPLDFKLALETLIPESWLNPNSTNAKSFIHWLKQVRFFELTYSNYLEVLPLLSELTK